MKRKQNEDLNFLRQKARESAPAETPESLSPENIEALVTGKKQKKHRRPVRAIVSVAVAACVVLTSAVVLRDTVIAPYKVKRTVKNAGTPVSYTQVARRLESQQRERSYKGFYFGGAKFAADDAMVQEAEGAVAAAPAANQAAAGGMRESASEYAETNVRTEGVLEADRVKTDGKYLYALAEQQLLIVDPAGEMRLVSSVDLSETDRNLWSDGFYLLGDRVLILGSYYDDASDKEKTAALLYDISDPAAPVRLRAIRWDGHAVSSRITQGRLLLVTNFYPDAYEFKKTEPATFLPACTVDDGDPVCVPEESLYLGGGEEDASFTTVSILPLSSPEAEPQSITLFGNVDDIYCTAETLYAYSAVYPDAGVFFQAAEYSVTTCIQKLDVSGEIPVIAASGSVSGTVLNTFALDEYNGYLRVAAGDGAGNRVFVLDEELKQAGVSEVLAEGEYIRSVRFMGAYAYVVTFRQTDPLFVLDLSDPAAPALKGEVKLPGFSAYLHPAGEGYLLGIGYGGTEEGLDGSAKISVFDVRDPANPRETGSVTLQDANLNTDYKAFVTLPDGTFLLPCTKSGQVKNERPAETEPETEATPAEPETAAPAEETTAAPAEETEILTSAANTPEEPATAAVDAYWDGDFWEEYIWTVTPGALRVAVENGVPVLRQTYAGEAVENDWPEARASFIGTDAFVLSFSYDHLRVERFYLDDGTRTGLRDFPVDADYEDPVVYNGAEVFE